MARFMNPEALTGLERRGNWYKGRDGWFYYDPATGIAEQGGTMTAQGVDVPAPAGDGGFHQPAPEPTPAPVAAPPAPQGTPLEWVMAIANPFPHAKSPSSVMERAPIPPEIMVDQGGYAAPSPMPVPPMGPEPMPHTGFPPDKADPSHADAMVAAPNGRGMIDPAMVNAQTHRGRMLPEGVDVRADPMGAALREAETELPKWMRRRSFGDYLREHGR